ncbi:MAG: APC family permease, partial [Actinobacteria bacterium]|nr:APC family permease [Actinomycetota bacterium]
MADSGPSDIQEYITSGLSRETNWWGAFVVGLAGTILITGVTGPVLGALGAAALPQFFFWTVTGGLLCLFLAELATMLPDRAGGAPAYAFFAFQDKFPRAMPHINGVTLWMYWLGWMPVMAVNMILTGAYLPTLFGFTDSTPTFQIFSNSLPVSVFTLIVGAILSVAIFIPAYLGIRFGTVFATVLGLLGMIPLTLLAIIPFFRPSTMVLDNIFPFNLPDGTGLFTGHSMFLALQFSALYTWNVIAMEAAACYLAECRNPSRDAPIAMTLEGGYGVFLYTVLPISFLAVLGQANISADPLALFSTFTSSVLGTEALDKIVTIMLLVALALSSLNAIMGCARSLYQMSLDGQCPRVLGHVNRHNVPDVSMGLNTLLNIVLIAFGAPATIYVFSNVGYVGSFVPVLLGYYYLRKWKPDLERPYRLPEFMKYIAFAMAVLYFIVWAFGIPS